MFYCYIISNSTFTKFYIGYTINPIRRLRQHNREIKGGAKYTRNDKWTYICIFSNIPDKISCLQCEWRLKHPIKKIYNINNKINCFIDYILKNNKFSPNGSIINYKLILFINSNYNIINVKPNKLLSICYTKFFNNVIPFYTNSIDSFIKSILK